MSKDPLFSVSDPIELLALWRLVAEAKFQSNPDDTDLWGSPHVHVLAQRIANSLLRHKHSEGNLEGIERHKKWIASLPDNVVLPVVKAQLRKDAAQQWWQSQSEAAKLAYVRGCVAPFEVDEKFLHSLVREAET